MTQDELKKAAALAALDYIEDGSIVGVGTGSTVNHFIDALGGMRERVAGAVSSSEKSSQRLRALGIEVLDANMVERLAVYVDARRAPQAGGRRALQPGNGVERQLVRRLRVETEQQRAGEGVGQGQHGWRSV